MLTGAPSAFFAASASSSVFPCSPMRLHASASSSAMAWGCNFGDMPLFFRGTSPRHGGKLAVNGPCQIGGRGAGSLKAVAASDMNVSKASVSFAGASQAASHMPYPAVAPMSPAPRTSMFRMASQSALSDVIVAVSKRWGQHMLVNDMQAIRLIKPDRPIRFPVYVHFLSLPIGYFYVSYP